MMKTTNLIRSVFAIGAISKLIGVQVTGINAVSAAGNFVVIVMYTFRIPRGRHWLGGTPLRLAMSLQEDKL